jgi:hypothetical protein
VAFVPSAGFSSALPLQRFYLGRSCSASTSADGIRRRLWTAGYLKTEEKIKKKMIKQITK